jgi:hypothetical protein
MKGSAVSDTALLLIQQHLSKVMDLELILSITMEENLSLTQAREVQCI